MIVCMFLAVAASVSFNFVSDDQAAAWAALAFAAIVFYGEGLNRRRK